MCLLAVSLPTTTSKNPHNSVQQNYSTGFFNRRLASGRDPRSQRGKLSCVLNPSPDLERRFLRRSFHFLEDIKRLRKVAIAFSRLGLVTLIVACAAKALSSEKVIKSASAGHSLTVSLATSDGVLKHGNTEFMLSFADSAGKPVDAGAVALTFHMPPMGAIQAMNNAASFTTTDTAGVCRGKANIEMTGEWQAQITYDGPKGRGRAVLPVTAQ